MNNNFIEMFSDIGGMGYGLMQAGWNCVRYAEIDKYAHQAYEILHDPEKRMWNAYDVKSVTDDDLRLLGRERGPIQLLAGGFPCQSFSIAGKRKGFTDATRGTLFFEIIRWASILRPKYLLLENVTGLLNHDEGRTFQTVIGSLDELGYVGEWCVLNSSAYVPQNRERIFIVASAGGERRPQVFPFGSEVKSNAKQFSQGEGSAYCLDTGYAKGISVNYMDKARRTMIVEPAAILRQVKNEHGKAVRKEYEAGKIDEGRQSMVKLEPRTDGIANTLTTVQKDNMLLTGSRIRRLTPLECFRLQSYPDWWYYKLIENGMKDTQLYKMAGNGVTSAVTYEIGKRLIG